MTDLYRHFDATGKLLYVGISKNTLVRLGQHQEHAHWYNRIAQVTIQKFPTRAEALVAERNAIAVENPLCNLQRPPNLKSAVRESKVVEVAKSSAKALTKNIVWFNTTYTASGIAAHLSIGLTGARRLIDSGEIGSIEVEDRGRTVRRVTGWQLIEYLESKSVSAQRSNEGKKQ